MKLRNRIAGFFLLALGSYGSAFAADQVTMAVLPVISNAPTFNSYPVKVSLRNDGETAEGTLTVGGESGERSIPISLQAKQTTSFIAYGQPSQLEVPLGEKDGVAQVSEECYIVFRLKTTSKSGNTDIQQKFSIPAGLSDFLLISNNRKGLDYLTIRAAKAVSPKGRTSKATPVKKRDGTELVKRVLGISVLRPSVPMDRATPLLYKTIFLGSGSKAISDGEVKALQEYLIGGGQIVIGTSPNSAFTDSRWDRFRGAPGSHSGVGYGDLVTLGFDPESENGDVHFARRVERSLENDIHLIQPAISLSSDEESFRTKADNDPFRVHLPTFAQVASILAAYFLFVIPANYLILRKIQRTELIVITAPILAVLFSALLLRSGAQLYKAPASVAVDGNLICDGDVDNCLYQGEFEIFSPTAGTYNLNLKDTVNIFPTSSIGHLEHVAALNNLVDTGTVNIPDYRTTNLQFRQFRVESVPANNKPIEFKLERAPEGLWLLSATNRSGRRISDATLVAGRYSTAGRTIDPGQTISVSIDDLHPLPYKAYSAEAQSREGNYESLHPLRQTALGIEAQGRIALLGREEDIPLGPHLAGPHVFRSKVDLLYFAPKSLTLP